MDWRRFSILSGILAPLLWLSLIGIAGAMRPGFSHVTQYISELGERGSSTEVLMRYVAFEFTGFLYLCFASTLLVTIRKKGIARIATCLIALDGIGRMGAGVFPCDPGCIGGSLSQDLHRMFATVGFVSGSLAAIAWGVTFRKMDWPQGLAWYSIGTGPLALILLLLMSWGQNPMNTPGLFEHLATGILSLWLIVFAAYLFRKMSRLE